MAWSSATRSAIGESVVRSIFFHQPFTFAFLSPTFQHLLSFHQPFHICFPFTNLFTFAFLSPNVSHLLSGTGPPAEERSVADVRGAQRTAVQAAHYCVWDPNPKRPHGIFRYMRCSEHYTSTDMSLSDDCCNCFWALTDTCPKDACDRANVLF